jgi:glycosyltransferase involved in cell wall biosynthesis
VTVVISNGFSRFHLAPAAAEAARRNILARFLTGAYPPPRLSRLADAHRLPHKLSRLAARAEPIPDGKIVALWGAELLHQVAMTAIDRPVVGRAADMVVRASLRAYGRAATRHVSQCGDASVYHYRAGFGWESAEAARRLGMLTICDHSIAHPALVEFLVANGGAFPARPLPDPGGFWGDVLRDIERADHVLVNSDFVRDTFVAQGWDPARVHVLYWGVDDAFFAAVPPRATPDDGPLRLAFAGHFARRKGVDALAEALRGLDGVPWILDVLGSVDRESGARHHDLLADPRVHVHGTVSREELAARLSQADVFVFPSLAEGSARVVFEAMACGCYVVTTPNAGTVVEDGVHGRVVPPGDPQAVRSAIAAVAADRALVSRVGAANAALVRSTYSQSRYGSGLSDLYASLSGSAA